MKIKLIIDRLKSHAPIFGGRVAGAADFNAEVEAAKLPPPSAYVIRANAEASEAGTMGEVVQMVYEEFAIVVAVDNSKSTVGTDAEESLDPVIEQVRTALLGWIGEEQHNAFEYVRDDHIGFDRSRLWHQMVFRTSTPISSLPEVDLRRERDVRYNY